MRRLLRRRHAAFVLLCAAAMGVGAAPAGAQELTLKRVMLSSGGVGYFEYEAQVEGDAQLTLEVPLDQVDDVLKSLVIYDAAGTVGEITLPGRQPLTQSFADLPFGAGALNSTTDLLNALQGAEIRVPGTPPMTGRLLNAAKEGYSEGILPAPRTRVTVLTDAGLQSFVLQDVASISFVDPGLQSQVATALARIAQYHASGRRRLTLSTHGTTQRTVRVGYVAGAPVWKASYRLVLPTEPQSDKARLQGWAVLENFSGQPWRDVELTLLSGNPVTFRQALYESYYVNRPTVPVETGSPVLPYPDTGSARVPAMAAEGAPPPPVVAPAPPPPPAAMATPLGASAPLSRSAKAAPAPAQIVAAEATEDTTQIAFTLPLKVSADAGQSMVLPIIDRELPGRRIDLYQPETSAQHPLAAVELTNASDTGLPPGVLTLYEMSAEKGSTYLGDARLAAFPLGEKRLLSYAVDQKLSIDRTVAERRYVVKATIAQGVMRVTRLIRQTTNYTLSAAAGARPAVVIEHPRDSDWTLSSPDPKGVEATATAYRIPVALDDKGQGSMAVTEDQPIEETIGLVDLSDQQLAVFVNANDLSPAVRQALGQLALRRQAVAGRQSDLARLTQQRDQLVADEKRLRDIIAPLGKESALRRRTIEKLGDTENAVESLAGNIATATNALAAAQDDLRNFIAGLSL